MSLPNWVVSISPPSRSRGEEAGSTWSFPCPLAWFPYGSVEEDQRSLFDGLLASPYERISKAGAPHLSSMIKPIWATTGGCKALALSRLPPITTSKLQAPEAWSLSPLIEALRGQHIPIVASP